jgi:hypothetical protein
LVACGSTRQLGLLRITLSWLLWSSWGYELVLHFDLHPDRIALAISFFVAVWLMFIGFQSRLASAWVGITLIVTTFHLGESRWTIWSDQHRQFTAVLALLLALAPCGRSFSVDRYIALGRAERRGHPAPAEIGSLWICALLRGFTGAVFLVTTLSLVDAEWTSGRLVAAAMFGGFRQSTELSAVAVVLAWILLAAHGFVTLGLWFERTKTAALWTGAISYLFLYVAMPSLSTLPLTVCWLLFTFVPADAVHRAIDRLHGRDLKEQPGPG